MRRTALVLALLTLPSVALALRMPADPIVEVERVLRASSDPYARTQGDRLVGWMRAARERVTSAPPGACRQLAEGRLAALFSHLRTDPSRASRAWRATRRIVLGLDECGVTGEHAASQLEVGAWLQATHDGPAGLRGAGSGLRAEAALGQLELSRSLWEPALASFGRAQALLAQTGDPILAADVARGVGEAQSRLGRPDEARASMREAIRIATVAGDRGRRAAADAWLGLGYVHAGQREYVDALAAYAEARALRVAIVGPDDPWTAELDNAAAVALGELRRYAEAIARNRAVLAVRSSALGAGHPETLISRSNIAVMLAASGDRAGSLAAHRELLTERERWLDRYDPSIAVTLTALARLEAQSGSLVVAEASLRRALAIRVRLPARHPDRGLGHAAYASFLLTHERGAEAVPLAERAVALAREAHGDVHPDVASTWALLARCAQAAGERDRAAEARAAEARARGTAPPR